jgi:uncharacterized membrane protein YkgB
MNKEGEYKPGNIAWHEANNSYTFSYGLGDTEHGFPYLSAAGRLVIKDVIMLGAGIATIAQATKNIWPGNESRCIHHNLSGILAFKR